MKEVLESNKMKPQHFFIGAMIINLALYFFWKSVRLFEIEIPNLNLILALLSIIERVTYFSSLYFLMWIERRIDGDIRLKWPLIGLGVSELVVALIIPVVSHFYFFTTGSYIRIALSIPAVILMVVFIYFLLRKRGTYSAEFKFIGTSLLASKIIMAGSSVLLGMVADQYFTENFPYSFLSEITGFVILVPKIAILSLMIKSLRESAESEIETLEN